jgi:succinoglycan biosynthesis transport protein ExoP
LYDFSANHLYSFVPRERDLMRRQMRDHDEANMVAQQPLPYFDVSQEMDDGLSVRALLASIRRHLGVVLALCLLFCAAGAVIGLGLPPWFQAEAVLVIHSRPERVSDVQEVLPDASPDLLLIRSEVDILQSRSVIEPVVRSLALWGLPEFQKREYPGGWTWEALETRLLNMWEAVGGRSTAHIPEPVLAKTSRNDDDVPGQAKIDEAVEKYMGYLNVSTDLHSMTIHVSYRAWTPERAAAIVNAHLESYEQLQVQAKTAAAQSANSWLTKRVDELQNQLQTAESAVARYREEHHLTGAAKDKSALSQQLVTLNSQLIAAQADLAESETRAASVGGRAATKGGADSVPEVVASPTIELLRGQEAQLVQREADLSAHHGDSYPELQNVRGSLRDLRGAINREIGRGHAAALQLVERSRARERSVQQAILELTKQVNSADAGLQQLEGRAESIRTVLHGVEKRAEQTSAGPAFIASNSTIISRANPSATSSSSKAPVLAGAGGFVGLTLGGLLALFLEHRDKTFRTSTQVQQQVNLHTIGATPRAARRRRKSPADMLLDDSRSAVAEAFRLCWANVQLAIEGPNTGSSFGGRGTGTVLGITSAAAGEGKSTHALAFARTAALAGDRVVLVDADLRRSGVSRLVGGDPRFTLSDFLRGRCTADEVVAVEERSGTNFVPSTPFDAPWTSQDLRRFGELIGHLKSQFALVIIDMPPILGLAETIRLTVAADSIALIIRWGRTERQLVRYALDTLRNAGAFASAVVLNDIDVKAQQRRGYQDCAVAYSNEGVCREEPASRVPPLVVASASEANPDAGASEVQRPDPGRNRARGGDDPVKASTIAKSDIQRLYERHFRE